MFQVKGDKGSESIMFNHSFLLLMVLGSKHKQGRSKKSRSREIGVQKGKRKKKREEIWG